MARLIKKIRFTVLPIVLFLTIFWVIIFGTGLSSFQGSKEHRLLPSLKVHLQEPKIKPAKLLPLKTDFEYESSDLIAGILYKKPSRLYKVMVPSGANAVNALWERNETKHWYIEAQRTGEEAIIGGLVRNDSAAILAGFQMFDWGFDRQAADGSFTGTAGFFHGTSFFVQAVARALLVIQQSPQSREYAEDIIHYIPLVHKAARWMIAPEVWKRGIEANKPYTHRYYVVATALGLTGKLTGDRELIDYACLLLKEGLSQQRPDGVNPEKGGYDSSYQMAGVMYAARWVTYFPEDPLTPKIQEMIEKALIWENTRILRTGEIIREGNTRTAGQETRLTGEVKKIDARTAFRGFAYWALVTGNSRWELLARQIAQFYYRN